MPRPPSVSDLPAPPRGRMGWPWTEGSPVAPELMPDGRPWPRIAVVTPSYNQADFLEETIRAVLLQGYPALEYLVMDGGSSDGSAEIIRKYEPWLAGWVSEPDRGQSHAINKGFARSRGEIMAWLNSDDIYYPGALRTAALEMERNGCDLLLGAMDKVQIEGDGARFVKRSSPHRGEPIHPFPILGHDRRYRFHFFQPSMFWRRQLWERAGGLDERYHFVMDMEWCNRALAAGATVVTIEDVLTRFALHPTSKSQALHQCQLRERALMYLRLAGRPEFRLLQCLLSSLGPAQGALFLAARAADGDRRPAKAFAYRSTARALKALRHLVPGLRGSGMLRNGGAVPGTSNGSEP